MNNSKILARILSIVEQRRLKAWVSLGALLGAFLIALSFFTVSKPPYIGPWPLGMHPFA